MSRKERLAAALPSESIVENLLVLRPPATVLVRMPWMRLD
jgi:hypothetical protein